MLIIALCSTELLSKCHVLSSYPGFQPWVKCKAIELDVLRKW